MNTIYFKLNAFFNFHKFDILFEKVSLKALKSVFLQFAYPFAYELVFITIATSGLDPMRSATHHHRGIRIGSNAQCDSSPSWHQDWIQCAVRLITIAVSGLDPMRSATHHHRGIRIGSNAQCDSSPSQHQDWIQCAVRLITIATSGLDPMRSATQVNLLNPAYVSGNQEIQAPHVVS